ncbi:MAG TPA: hypothetical protein VMA98_03120 [Candidatus Acidoferrales bacterium]|nr:hypothetical protein [Candidatus Acidoferrales bacterium]
MLLLPDRLDAEALRSPAPVFPVHLDRLRTCVQQKLGWGPLESRRYFIAFMPTAKSGELSVGTLVSNVLDVHGAGAALVVLRALLWFGSEAQIKREHRRAFKQRI